QLERVQSYGGIAISPDGTRVAWTQPARDNARNSEIYSLNWKDSSAKPERVTAGDGQKSFRETGVAWSPDSTQIAFFSNAGSRDQDQVYVMPAKGGSARQLTKVKGYVTDIRWAPDGNRLAFLYAENGGGGGPLEAVPAQTGVIGTDIHNQRLVTVTLGNGELRQVSP